MDSVEVTSSSVISSMTSLVGALHRSRSAETQQLGPMAKKSSRRLISSQSIWRHWLRVIIKLFLCVSFIRLSCEVSLIPFSALGLLRRFLRQNQAECWLCVVEWVRWMLVWVSASNASSNTPTTPEVPRAVQSRRFSSCSRCSCRTSCNTRATSAF